MTTHADRTHHVLDTIDKARTDIAQHLTATLDRTAGWSSPLAASGGGPAPKGSVSDPTGRAASEPRPTTQGVHRALKDELDALERHAYNVRLILARNRPLTRTEAKRILDRDPTGTSGRASTLNPCDQVQCDDKALPGDPFCPACTAWLADHPDARVVPREVITNRNYKRAERTRNRETAPGHVDHELELVHTSSPDD